MDTVVRGYLAVELHLHGNDSLKGKRQVVKSLKDRLRNRFNVSVAELEPLDEHRRAVIALVTVSKDHAVVDRTIEAALDFIVDSHLAEVVESHRELW